jgi:hypothetical protein
MSVTLKLEIHKDAKVLTAKDPHAPSAEFDVDVTVRNVGPEPLDLSPDEFEFVLHDETNTTIEGVRVDRRHAALDHPHLDRGEEGTLHTHLEVPGGRVRPNTPYYLVCNAYDDRAKTEFQFL